MKNTVKRIKPLALIVCIFFALGMLFGCAPEEAKNEGFVNHRDKLFYGIGDSLEGGASDLRQTVEMTTALSGAMGFSTFRLWMHTGSNFVKRNPATNELYLDERLVEYYKSSIQKLIDGGVTHIIGLSHYYIYPAGMNVKGDTLGIFPEPGTVYYEMFLNDIEATYYLLATTFPMITYWECGNEINANMYCHKPGYNTASNKAPYIYTLDEKSQIGTDLMFYANRGIKRANEKTLMVMPGLVFSTSSDYNIIRYIRNVYSNIASGMYPSTGTYISTANDDYFNVLNWHPYNFSGNSGETSDLVTLSNTLYEIAKEGGDDGKKVILSEFGYTSTQSGNDPAKRAALEEKQAGYIAKDMENIWNFLPYVESVIMFRLFDWENAGPVTGNTDTIETGFGLFTSPGMNSGDPGPKPKPIGLALFKAIKGANADTTPLYQFYNG